MATLLYEQFIHLTLITLRPNIQFFEQSTACLSVFLEPLPGSILFTIL